MPLLSLLSLLLFHLVWLLVLWGGGTRPALARKPTDVVKVITLTRHGSRAPNKALAKQSCVPLLDADRDGKNEFFNLFGVRPSELTRRGVQEMRDVGRYLRERYERMGLIQGDYAAHTKDYLFIARQGDRQQRSMQGIAQGMFPDDVVPIQVTDRTRDYLLSAPPPVCARFTSKMIIDWHATTGRRYVHSRYAEIKPFEKLCNVSLRDNPVDVQQFGANPHAFIGDISDLMDAWALERDEPMPITAEQHQAITEIAYNLEQGSHFEDPRGPGVFVGDFVEALLLDFESIVRNGGKILKQSKGIAGVSEDEGGVKMKMNTCSRELFYGLENMFGWNETVRVAPGQPKGRIVAATTFIWELQRDGIMNFLYFQTGWTNPKKLQESVHVKVFRQVYDDYVRSHGDWKKVCGARKRDDSGEGDGCEPCACSSTNEGDSNNETIPEPYAKINDGTSSSSSSSSGKEKKRTAGSDPSDADGEKSSVFSGREVRDAASVVIVLTLLVLGVRVCARSARGRASYRPL